MCTTLPKILLALMFLQYHFCHPSAFARSGSVASPFSIIFHGVVLQHVTKEPTPRSTVLLEKLPRFIQTRNFLQFMEFENSLQSSPELATCPYPEPKEFSPNPFP
jgi:hypothetical protein